MTANEEMLLQLVKSLMKDVAKLQCDIDELKVTKADVYQNYQLPTTLGAPQKDNSYLEGFKDYG